MALNHQMEFPFHKNLFNMIRPIFNVVKIESVIII